MDMRSHQKHYYHYQSEQLRLNFRPDQNRQKIYESHNFLLWGIGL